MPSLRPLTSSSCFFSRGTAAWPPLPVLGIIAAAETSGGGIQQRLNRGIVTPRTCQGQGSHRITTEQRSNLVDPTGCYSCCRPESRSQPKYAHSVPILGRHVTASGAVRSRVLRTFSPRTPLAPPSPAKSTECSEFPQSCCIHRMHTMRSETLERRSENASTSLSSRPSPDQGCK